jgi:hypothetical protein
MHRRIFVRTLCSALTSVFLTIFFAACLSFGDLSGGTSNSGDASTTTTFSIGGTITGLEGASASLVDNGADSITVSSDGTFVFPTKLTSGSSYAVSVSAPPAKHICAVQNGSGVATADVTNISVSCPSTSVTLSSLSLSNGTLAPAFSAAVLSYTANVSALIFSPSTTVTAEAASPSALIAIDGKPATAGTATVDVAIATTPRPISIVVTSADGSSTSTTIVTVEPSNEQIAYFKASNTNSGRQFGSSVALSADGSTLAIGAPYEASAATGVNDTALQHDSSQSAAGAVYVFTKSGGTWAQTAYVKASNARSNSFFGESVSLNGDGTVLAVGAFGESSAATGINNTTPGQSDTTAANAGAVFIFVNTAGTWAQTTYVKPLNTRAGNRFGNAVSLSASGTSLAVGSFLEASNAVGINGNENDTSDSSAGAAYLFENNSGWSQTAYFKASNANEGHRFGKVLALSGDGNSLVVGAASESSASTGVNSTTPGPADTTAFSSGAAYIFAKAGGAWSQTAYVKPSNTRANEAFGYSVAISADGTTVAVGANAESSAATGVNNTSPGQGDTSAAGAGAVYVFANSGGNWAQSAYVKASNTRANAAFGQSVALSGDGTRLAVGATGESSGSIGIDGDQTSTSATGAGAEYVFLKGAAGWAQTAYVKASNNRASASFGGASAFSSNGLSLIVGAAGESSAATGVNNTTPGPGDTSAPSSGAAYLFQ